MTVRRRKLKNGVRTRRVYGGNTDIYYNKYVPVAAAGNQGIKRCMLLEPEKIYTIITTIMNDNNISNISDMEKLYKLYNIRPDDARFHDHMGNVFKMLSVIKDITQTPNSSLSISPPSGSSIIFDKTTCESVFDDPVVEDGRDSKVIIGVWLNATTKKKIIAKSKILVLPDPIEDAPPPPPQQLPKTQPDTYNNDSTYLAQCRQELIAVKEERDQAKLQADTLLKRSGQSHIKRDWERLKGGGPFPAGSDLRENYINATLNFESFACDALEALEALTPNENCPKIFTNNVMKPLYMVTQNYVNTLLDNRKQAMNKYFGASLPVDLTNDTISKLFWFVTLQEQIPRIISNLTDPEIMELIQTMGSTVIGVHKKMLELAKQDKISHTENDLRIPGIVRDMLMFFAHCALSDPTCFLQPVPGTKIAYKLEIHKEILSPGAKIHGQIGEGTIVEVVFPGLYFENAVDKFDTIKPVVNCLVRRIPS